MFEENDNTDLINLLSWLGARLAPNTPIPAYVVDETAGLYRSWFSSYATRHKKLPKPQVLARFVRALRLKLAEKAPEWLPTTTVPRAFIAAGFMTEEDLNAEIHGGAVIDVSHLSPVEQAAVRSFIRFLETQDFKSESESFRVGAKVGCLYSPSTEV